jgi:hypothetical protein
MAKGFLSLEAKEIKTHLARKMKLILRKGKQVTLDAILWMPICWNYCIQAK